MKPLHFVHESTVFRARIHCTCMKPTGRLSSSTTALPSRHPGPLLGDRHSTCTHSCKLHISHFRKLLDRDKAEQVIVIYRGAAPLHPEPLPGNRHSVCTHSCSSDTSPPPLAPTGISRPALRKRAGRRHQPRRRPRRGLRAASRGPALLHPRPLLARQGPLQAAERRRRGGAAPARCVGCSCLFISP